MAALAATEEKANGKMAEMKEAAKAAAGLRRLRRRQWVLEARPAPPRVINFARVLLIEPEDAIFYLLVDGHHRRFGLEIPWLHTSGLPVGWPALMLAVSWRSM